MKRLPTVQPKRQTATVLEFKRPVNVLTQKSQAEIEAIEEQENLNLYRKPIYEFTLDCNTTQDELEAVIGFIQHLRAQASESKPRHLSMVQ